VQVHILQQEVKTREDDIAKLDELRAALDLERSNSAQLSDVIGQLRLDIASEKASYNELVR